MPATDDAAVQQPQRELRLAPDGTTVGFSQVRDAEDGATAFVVGRSGRSAATAAATSSTTPGPSASLGELKNFTPDGTAVLISAFTTLPDRAADPDVVRIDLATGEQTDVTDNGDYDEDIAFAPDQRVLRRVQRPGRGPVRDGRAGPPTERHRPRARRAVRLPVRRATAGSCSSRGWCRPEPSRTASSASCSTRARWRRAGTPARWSAGTPTATALLFWEDRGDPFDAPTADGTRFVVVHLTDREPSPAPGRRPVARSDLGAASSPATSPSALPVAESRDGEVSGRVTVDRTPSAPQPGAGTIEVTYEDFSDDGEWVIDGTESAIYDGGLTGGCRYRPTSPSPATTRASCGPTPPSPPARSTARSSPRSTAARCRCPEPTPSARALGW